MNDDANKALTILRRTQIERLLGVSKSTIYQWMNDGAFPAPISLGARAIGWLASDVEKWLADRASQSRNNQRL